jgi:hypothetical protein
MKISSSKTRAMGSCGKKTYRGSKYKLKAKLYNKYLFLIT